jgi:rhodanese-related sulfurtransferase
MLKRLLSAAALVILSLIRSAMGQQLTHTKDSLETVKENLQAGKAVLVDVREQNEWDAGHLKAAVLMPQSKLKVESQLPELLKTLPRDKIIYTHCRAGGRALTCGDILKREGFDVRPLKAGFEELVGAGFERGADKR